jgi:hypothetical protein
MNSDSVIRPPRQSWRDELAASWRSLDFWIWAACALLFLALAGIRLAHQGAYYDELHQATASFAFTGQNVSAAFSVKGYPVLNMAYSGAIKSTLYGLYLSFFEAEFTLLSWRLFGLLFVSAAMVISGILVKDRIPRLSLAAFLALLLSDGSCLIMCRHDWGPVALALSIRLVFLAFWLRGETDPELRPGNSLALGVCVGLAVFEKLSSATLLIPLLLILAFSRRRRFWPHWLGAGAGVLAGASPLILVNAYTLLEHGFMVSLRGVVLTPALTWAGFLRYATDYLFLGNGSLARGFVLGERATGAPAVLEGWLLSILLLLTAASLVIVRSRSRWKAPALLALAVYLLTGVAIYLLPQNTWIHHWILGTPFQYLAIVLACAALTPDDAFAGVGSKRLVWAMRVSVALFLCLRVCGLISLQTALWEGRSAVTWDPSLNRFAEFSARQADQAAFIAADWGIANQVVCLGNGETQVFEQFWAFRGAEDIQYVIDKSRKAVIYVVVKDPPSRVAPENTARILAAMRATPGWREAPPEQEVADLRAVRVYKFVKS